MTDWTPPVSDAAAIKATGRDWAGWREELDRWAGGLPHAEIASRLHEAYGLSGWWAQTVTVSWEMMTGRRRPHEKPDGFQAAASKTIAAPSALLEAAFTEASVFAGWGPEGEIAVTKATPGKWVNGRWSGGGRLSVMFTETGGKTRVAVNHERLPDAEACERMKSAWREALARLKAKVEG